MSHQRILLILPLFCVSILAVIGCGAKNPQAPASISGGISFKGKPVPGGTIQFVPATGAPYASSISSDGTYAIADLPTGEMVITVETESLNPDKKAAAGGKDADRRSAMMGNRKGPNGQGSASSSGLEPQYLKIPEKYSKPKTSPLTYTVKNGRQVYSVELE